MVERKRGTKPPAKKIWSTEQRCFELLRDRSLPSGIGKGGTSEDLARRAASVQAAISKELHRIGADGRVRDLFLTQSGKYRGSTDPTMSAEQLTRHRDEVLRAARAVDPSVTDLETRTASWWVKAHAIQVARYLGKGLRGTDLLREELEVENEGSRSPPSSGG